MIFTRVFTVVFLLVWISSVVITFILPESYASTARIKLDITTTDTNVWDPHFLQTAFETIQSQAVLNPVIEKLNLNVVWGRKYSNGETLKTSEALEILKKRLLLKPVRGTGLIDITVYSEDKNEAAQIANAVAEAYQNFSIERRKATQVPIDPLVIADRPSVIIDMAMPGLAPVRPNKPLNIFIGVVAGILLGSIAGGIAAGFASLSRDAKPPKRDPVRF